MHPSEASRGERKSISSGIWKGGSETLCCGLIESAKQHGRSSHHLFPSAFQLDRTPRGFCDSGGGLEPHSAVGARGGCISMDGSAGLAGTDKDTEYLLFSCTMAPRKTVPVTGLTISSWHSPSPGFSGTEGVHSVTRARRSSS